MNTDKTTEYTRLYYNLRPTIRECVNLVTRGHLWSCDKDGGHAIRSAIVENPMLRANFTALRAIEVELLLGYCRSKFYISGIGILDDFCCRDIDIDPTTYI